MTLMMSKPSLFTATLVLLLVFSQSLLALSVPCAGPQQSMAAMAMDSAMMSGDMMDHTDMADCCDSSSCVTLTCMPAAALVNHSVLAAAITISHRLEPSYLPLYLPPSLAAELRPPITL